jgi:hypothetical protein
MGAPGWRYVVSYQEDLGTALDALRRQVFVDGDFVSPAEDGYPEPASVEDLLLDEYGFFMGTNGTHSVLDVIKVVPAEETGQWPGTIRPLTPDETRQVFGTAQPGRADGAPAEIAFWGYSGD